MRESVRKDMKAFFDRRTVEQTNGDLWVYLGDKTAPAEQHSPLAGQSKLVYVEGPKPV